MSGRLVRGAALGIVVLGAAGIAWSATGGGSNVVGPRTRIQPTGRQLNPVGELTKLGTTLVIVTHEIGFAREVADRVVFLDGGRVLEQGTPARVLLHPQHPRTKDFLRKVL